MIDNSGNGYKVIGYNVDAQTQRLLKALATMRGQRSVSAVLRCLIREEGQRVGLYVEARS